MRTLIVDSLELLALILFAIAAAFALWPVHPALGLAGASVVVGVAAWWMGRDPKEPKQ